MVVHKQFGQAFFRPRRLTSCGEGAQQQGCKTCQTVSANGVQMSRTILAAIPNSACYFKNAFPEYILVLVIIHTSIPHLVGCIVER